MALPAARAATGKTADTSGTPASETKIAMTGEGRAAD
jgi:hypothetical protein